MSNSKLVPTDTWTSALTSTVVLILAVSLDEVTVAGGNGCCLVMGGVSSTGLNGRSSNTSSIPGGMRSELSEGTTSKTPCKSPHPPFHFHCPFLHHQDHMKIKIGDKHFSLGLF